MIPENVGSNEFLQAEDHLSFQYIWDGGGKGLGNGDSSISTKVMDLKAVIQYVSCLQFITKSQYLLEESKSHFVIYRIIYIRQEGGILGRLAREALLSLPIITFVPVS